MKLVEDRDFTQSSLTNHTFTVKGLCANSSLEYAKQLAYVATQEFIDDDYQPEYHLYSLFSLFTTYIKCPNNMSKITYNIIKSNLTDIYDTTHEIIDKSNEKVFEFITASNEFTDCFKRFYPESYKLDELILKMSNKQTLLLYNEIKNIYMNVYANETCFSACDYSKAVLSGKMTDDFVEYPILKHCLTYLQIIDKHITNNIIKVQNFLDDKTCGYVIQLLNWRDRFVKLSSEAIFTTTKTKRKQVLREDIVPLLYMHSKWLHKYLFDGFCNIASNEKLTRDFKIAIKIIDENYEENNTQMKKVGKKLRKLCGQPKLCMDREEYDLCLARNNIYNKLTINMTQPIERQLNKLSLDNSAVTDISLAFDVPDSDKVAIIQENIAKIEDNTKLCDNGFHVKLIPLTSYVINRVLTMIRINFLETLMSITRDNKNRLGGNDYGDILSNVVHLIKVTKGCSPALLNLLEVTEYIQRHLHGTLSLR